ncbi:hypothetical protein ACFLW2_01340 [Chloroflexota bacterium]
MSRLIKRLRQVSESVAPSLGFKTASTSPAQTMLLIATLPKSDASQIAEIADAGIDAVLVRSRELAEELQTLRQMSDSIGDIPWGVWPDVMTGEDIKELCNMGGDFITFAAPEAPAALLGEEIGKVIKLSPPLDDGLIRTINQLPIDAVLLDFRGEGESITVSHLMDCQRLAGSIHKPLMVAIEQMPDDKEIQALWEAGVNGVVIEVAEESQPDFAGLRQAIISLPQTRRKSAARGAMLPRLDEESGSTPPEDTEEI